MSSEQTNQAGGEPVPVAISHQGPTPPPLPGAMSQPHPYMLDANRRGRRGPARTIIKLAVLAALVGAGYWFRGPIWAWASKLLPNSSAAAAGAPGGGAGSAGSRPVPVKAAKARLGDMPIYLDQLGTVTALNAVTVHTRVDGQLIKVGFVEGQVVRKGDMLAELDPRPFEVQLTQAEGQKDRDEGLLLGAQKDLARYIAAGDAATQQQRDQAAANVAQYTGNVENDQGQIDSAKLNLKYCHITSPITGRVGLRLVDPGNIVHASDLTGLVLITQVDPIAVFFSLPQDNLPQIPRFYFDREAGTRFDSWLYRALGVSIIRWDGYFSLPLEDTAPENGLPVEALDRNLKRKLASGKLMAVDNQIDPSTLTLRFKAVFPNANSALVAGQFVNVRLLVDTLKNVVLAPTAAVQRAPSAAGASNESAQQDVLFVYVVRPDNSIEMRTVKAGPTEGGNQCIQQGLAAGETVVTDGVDKLVPGFQDGVAAPTPGSKVVIRQDSATTQPNGKSATQPNGPSATKPAVRGG